MFVLDLPLPTEAFLYLRLIIRIIFCISARLKASFVLTPVLNVNFLTSFVSHSNVICRRICTIFLNCIICLVFLFSSNCCQMLMFE